MCIRAPGVIGLNAPIADVEPGWLRIEWRPDIDQPDHPLSDSALFFRFTDYPTADLDDPDAVLYVRVAPNDEPVAIERSQWRFSDAKTVALEGGFSAFHWYTLVYRTNLCPVTGAGLLAVRDAVSSPQTRGRLQPGVRIWRLPIGPAATAVPVRGPQLG